MLLLNIILFYLFIGLIISLWFNLGMRKSMNAVLRGYKYSFKAILNGILLWPIIIIEIIRS